MSAHSVEGHLRVAANEYDSAIRTFVPNYEEMLRVAVELLGFLTPQGAKILDLGGGTGALTEAILQGLPYVHVELLDIDPEMIVQAHQRLGASLNRVTIRTGSFFDPLPTCDAVVASMSLHHIHDLGKKTEVYASIRQSLKPGGVFLNLDACVNADSRLNALTFSRWAAFMGKHGISEEEARGHFTAWAKEDRYFSIHEELFALSRAGFDRPECFWRKESMAVCGGLKST